MQANILGYALSAMVLAHPAWANSIVESVIPKAAVVGQGRLSMFFTDVYDAKLYAPNGVWTGAAPFALTLDYFLKIDGQAIADRSVSEIKKQGFSDTARLETWRKQMVSIFPNVSKGTKLTAVFETNGNTVFYRGATKLGVISDPEFSRRFADIWLGKATSVPDLRRALIGS